MVKKFPRYAWRNSVRRASTFPDCGPNTVRFGKESRKCQEMKILKPVKGVKAWDAMGISDYIIVAACKP